MPDLPLSVAPAPVRAAPAWTEAVFHVLAHVDAGPLAASCHDPAYVAWVASRLGPADARTLGEDARVLASVLASHDALARAQVLAWLWNDDAHVRASTARELVDLAAVDVADAGALVVARELGAPVEVLRAAAELELPRIRALGPIAIDEPAVNGALADVARAAPWLARLEVSLARSLPRRGRVYNTSIIVGAPGVAGAELANVVWQAAHEATVVEVEHAPAWAAHGTSFESVERTALGLLRSRARRAGLADAHGRWLATLDLGALGPIPDVDDRAE